jgi:hypothetical protein
MPYQPTDPTPPLFELGDTVYRIENRDVTKASIIDIQNTNGSFEIFYELQYEEGGTGWWPEHCLSP